LNCEIGFQDLEKVLNLAKTHIKVLKKYRNSNFSRLFILPLMTVLQMFSALCLMNKIL